MSKRLVYAGGEGWQSFLRQFNMQCHVVGALIMRELHTRYGRENIGYLWLILEPLMLATAIASLHSGGEASHFGSDIRPVPFAIVGYCIFIIFRGVFTRAEGALEANRPLLYHRMVTILDMLVSRALLEGAGIGMTIIILMTLSILLGYADLPARPLWLIAAFFAMLWLSFAMSLICLAATHENRLVGRLVHPATYLLMPIAGGFYMLRWIPEPYRDMLSYVPFVNIFEMARYGQFEAAPYQYFDVLYILAWCSITTVLGLLSIRIVRHHVHLS